jgi:ferredoxin
MKNLWKNESGVIKQEKKRTLLQAGFLAITNGYYKGFLEGSIYRGPTKMVCVPGLNCYSCPGAFGSCPLGAFQAVVAERNFTLSFYLIGFFMAVGALMGRFVCGFLCPFGLFQDLLHKIPFPRKWWRLPGEWVLKKIKYFLLLFFVFLLPAFVVGDFGGGDPWFCKYVCPSGTLMAGWPLGILNEGIRGAIGWLFAWKSLLLVGLILLSFAIYRPFCRYLCPLGAIYGGFNRVSLYRFQIDQDRCIQCGKCQQVCPFQIPTYQTPNSADCIRCGNCLRVCPTGALTRVSYFFDSVKKGVEVHDGKKENQ